MELLVKYLDTLTFADFLVILVLGVMLGVAFFFLLRWIYKATLESQDELLALKEQKIDHYKQQYERLLEKIEHESQELESTKDGENEQSKIVILVVTFAALLSIKAYYIQSTLKKQEAILLFLLFEKQSKKAFSEIHAHWERVREITEALTIAVDNVESKIPIVRSTDSEAIMEELREIRKEIDHAHDGTKDIHPFILANFKNDKPEKP